MKYAYSTAATAPHPTRFTLRGLATENAPGVRRGNFLAIHKTLSLLALSLVFSSSSHGSVIGYSIGTHATPHSSGCCGVAGVADNNYVTEYASNGLGVNTFIEFDLGSATTIAGMSHLNRGAADGIATSTLTFSDDLSFGGADPVVAINHISSEGTELNAMRFAPQTAQYVRWDVTSISGTHPNQGAREIRFHDASDVGRVSMAHIGSSGSFSASFDQTFFYDDRPGTEWAASGTGDNSFMDFDFGASTLVGGGFHRQRNNLVDNIHTADLIFSDDPTFTTGLTTRTVSFNTGVSAETDFNFAPVSARYMRFDVTASNGASPNVGGSEFFLLAPEPDGAITEIEYAPDTVPPTVTLTWFNTGAATYKAWLSRDLSDWSENLDDSITPEHDERPGDADHITVTFDLDAGREDEEDLFFRIEEVR